LHVITVLLKNLSQSNVDGNNNKKKKNTMKEVNGDLLAKAENGEFDVIIHGCNCFHTMGGGIAYFVKKKWPEAFTADLGTVMGSEDKLGSYSFANVTTENGNLIVINAYTQFGFGTQECDLDYTALSDVFNKIKKDFSGLRFGIPKIGAGLAGGNWDEISAIIEKEMVGEDLTLVIFG